MTRMVTLHEPKFRARKLTSIQMKVLAFICEKRATTFRQIASHFGWSGPNAALDAVRRLERKGLVRQDRGAARTIRPSFRFIPASEVMP